MSVYVYTCVSEVGDECVCVYVCVRLVMSVYVYTCVSEVGDER